MSEMSDNRRQFVRLPKGYGVELNELKFPMSPDESFPVTCADISTGGVCVESSEALEPGLRLQVKVHIPRLNKFMPGFFKTYENDAEQYLQAIAEVAWTEPAAAGYQVGLRFLDLDADTERALGGLIKKALLESGR